MESMVFDYIYLLKKYDAAFLSDVTKCTAEFIIPISEDICSRQRNLFLELNSTRHVFCFSLTSQFVKNKKSIQKDIIHNLVRILFLPNYLRLCGKHVFFIEEINESEKEPNRIQEGFLKELKKQGINSIVIKISNTENFSRNLPDKNSIVVSNSELNNYLQDGDKGIDYKMFTKRLVTPSLVNKKLIITVESLEDFQHKVKLLEHFENWLSDTNPLLTKLIKMCTRAEKESSQIKIENEILKFQLQNGLSYLKVVKENSQWYINEHDRLTNEVQSFLRQTTAQPGAVLSFDNHPQIRQLQTQIEAEQANCKIILEWYKREYEMLPTWYKQIGHLIKVATGKRTLKSLFK